MIGLPRHSFEQQRAWIPRPAFRPAAGAAPQHSPAAPAPFSLPPPQALNGIQPNAQLRPALPSRGQGPLFAPFVQHSSVCSASSCLHPDCVTRACVPTPVPCSCNSNVSRKVRMKGDSRYPDASAVRGARAEERTSPSQPRRPQSEALGLRHCRWMASTAASVSSSRSSSNAAMFSLSCRKTEKSGRGRRGNVEEAVTRGAALDTHPLCSLL